MRSGTLVICTQNLDYSGANQVTLNILAGRSHCGNSLILSPKQGSFSTRFGCLLILQLLLYSNSFI
jgi:hypothetical protein